ncbi:hypothetical protein BC829DRAFT_93699 [Chytridium lagenaria]|nr:hypothetical protein BC829DRAFT_93699 [Chytridium lagenaria]
MERASERATPITVLCSLIIIAYYFYNREAVKAGKDIFEKLKVNAHAQSQKDAAATAKDGGINNSNAVVSSIHR